MALHVRQGLMHSLYTNSARQRSFQYTAIFNASFAVDIQDKIRSGNGLLSDVNLPLPEAMLAYQVL